MSSPPSDSTAVESGASRTAPIWYGILDAGSREFRFSIEESTGPDGSVLHQLISFDEGERKFLLEEFRTDQAGMEFELKATRARYAGTFERDGSLVGTWKQARAEFGLTFRRQTDLTHTTPAEVWTGEIDAVLQKLTLRIRVHTGDGGRERVLFDSVTQNAGGFRAEREKDGGNWILRVPAIRGSFTGSANDAETEVTGVWSQGGLSLNLTLTRSAAEEVTARPVASRPQTPQAPFPYEIREVEFAGGSDDVRLAGTLTQPRTPARCPCVVLISGSGPQDRDETIAGHKPFHVIADHLSRHGIGVLRFDDRGVGGSTGDPAAATSEDFARDVESAVVFLLQNDRVSPSEIGLIGHSEGAIIAPLVASQRTDIAFIVLLAGTGVNGQQILLSQGERVLRAAGIVDDLQLRTQRTAQTILIRCALQAGTEPLSEESIAAALASIRDQLPVGVPVPDTTDDVLRAGLVQLQTPWFRWFLIHEPGPVLAKVTCQVLALNGEKDVQVDPALNLPAIEKSLVEAGHSQHTILQLPELNHLFQTCRTGAVSEYAEIEQTIAPVVLDTMTRWIRERTASTGVSGAPVPQP